MTTMDAVFYAIGVFSTFFFGLLGLAWIFDRVVDFIVSAFWTQKEFLAFVWERLKAKREHQ